MILWLMGISGAGKTTIGRKLQRYFNETGIKNYLLDGECEAHHPRRVPPGPK